MSKERSDAAKRPLDRRVSRPTAIEFAWIDPWTGEFCAGAYMPYTRERMSNGFYRRQIVAIKPADHATFRACGSRLDVVGFDDQLVAIMARRRGLPAWKVKDVGHSATRSRIRRPLFVRPHRLHPAARKQNPGFAERTFFESTKV